MYPTGFDWTRECARAPIPCNPHRFDPPVGANLKGAMFDNSQMNGVNLRLASLKGASLRSCNLRYAIMAGTDLEVSICVFCVSLLAYMYTA